MNILKYLNLALEIGVSVEGLLAYFKSATTVQGSIIEQIVLPSVQAVEQVFPKVNVPPALLTDVCNAAADAIDSYFKKQANSKA